MPPEKCYLPKKLIHTWSGHTKAVSSIKLFPKSGHLLLSTSMDCKVKVIAFTVVYCARYNSVFFVDGVACYCSVIVRACIWNPVGCLLELQPNFIKGCLKGYPQLSYLSLRTKYNSMQTQCASLLVVHLREVQRDGLWHLYVAGRWWDRALYQSPSLSR